MSNPEQGVAQVGYTDSDDDRDRWLAADVWLRRNDDAFHWALAKGQALGRCHHDAIDLNGRPPRDFLAESRCYDVVVVHNLWGAPGSVTGGDACSPLHSPAAWRRRLTASSARYIFLFGGDFTAACFDRCLPGYECFDVAADSFLSVFAAPTDRPAPARTAPITSRDMTAARLRALADLLGNEALDLSYTPVSGEHLAQLRAASRLKELHLAGASITEDDLRHVAHCRELKRLNLDGASISSAGIERLAPLDRLEGLSLNRTAVDDAGVAALRAFANLQWLSLVETAVSDRALGSLRQLSGLRHLSLVGTHVTPGGLAALRSALPECHVQGDE